LAPSRIAAIVLAAGRSTRMGGTNKLLAEIGGEAMVRRVVGAAVASKAKPVVVVTGHQEDDVRAVLAGLDIACVANPDYAAGLSTSLKMGIRSLPADCAGALILLGDMPALMPVHIDRLIDALELQGGGTILVPAHAGIRGNPVLWPATYFPEMLTLQGDAGAKRLMLAHADQVREIDLGSAAVLTDVDTPEALAQARGKA
jgi:molybdenum cofactor cytidylyltransferase